MVEFLRGVRLQKDLKAQFMGSCRQFPAFLPFEAGRNQQDGVRSGKARLPSMRQWVSGEEPKMRNPPKSI